MSITIGLGPSVGSFQFNYAWLRLLRLRRAWCRQKQAAH